MLIFYRFGKLSPGLASLTEWAKLNKLWGSCPQDALLLPLGEGLWVPKENLNYEVLDGIN